MKKIRLVSQKESTKLRDKFLKENIPYDDIDEKMIPLIDVLNFTCNLKTEFCCWGHMEEYNLNKISIIFDSTVTDKNIYDLLNFIWEEGITLFFYKWIRKIKDTELWKNWILKSNKRWEEEDQPDKIEYRDKLIEILKKYKKE